MGSSRERRSAKACDGVVALLRALGQTRRRRAAVGGEQRLGAPQRIVGECAVNGSPPMESAVDRVEVTGQPNPYRVVLVGDAQDGGTLVGLLVARRGGIPVGDGR